MTGENSFTTGDSISISWHFDTLSFRFEEAIPVFKAGVAEMLIVTDDHITITDLSQRPQAQMCDFSLGDSKAECTSVGAGEREKEVLNAKQTQKRAAAV